MGAVRLDIALRDGGRAVLGPVVHQDDLKIPEALLLQGGKPGLQIILYLIDRNNNTESHRFSLSAPLGVGPFQAFCVCLPANGLSANRRPRRARGKAPRRRGRRVL